MPPEQQSLAALPLNVTEIPADVALAVEASDRTVTPAQVQVLKATVCAKLNIAQLQLYLTICARKGVDPFTEAYGFPNEQGGIAFGLKIDGMRSLARRKATYSRTLELLTVPEHPEQVMGARCTITREGDPAPFVAEVLLREFAKGGNWNTMPEAMIKKVAEAHALRAAFPDALGGLYEPSEMERDDAGSP
ncbi:MAG: RecT family recombinase [Thermoplasmata archaeon]